MSQFRLEEDSLGKVKVPLSALWGAQTQRSLDFFSIGQDPMPKEMIEAFAILKKAAAEINLEQKTLSKEKSQFIVRVCNELLKGHHQEHFPLRVWMTGSGTQFNMNINEVIANRASQLAKRPLGSKTPLHPNDDVNLSQSSNDTFPTAMNIAVAMRAHNHLLPILSHLQKSLEIKAKKWHQVIKIGRTHFQDATPLTLGQEFSGYAALLQDNMQFIQDSLKKIFALSLGGTAIGTGVNTLEGFDKKVAARIAKETKLPFYSAENKFAVQGSHNALVFFSSALKSLAVSLYKVASDIRLLSSGPRAGLNELILPANEPGSSIMPGKINPTQCESMTMVALQVMANDTAVALGDASGSLEMNVYKPLIIHNIMRSMNLLCDAISNFDRFLIKDLKPNLKQIERHLNHSLMLVTALSPEIGYEKAAEIAHYAMEHELALKEAALKLGYVTEKQFDALVQPHLMCFPTQKKSEPKGARSKKKSF